MNSPLPPATPRPTVDIFVFMSAFLVVVGICVPLLVWPDASGPAIVAVYDWIAGHFGIFYQWAVIGLAAFLGWIAFSRHGRIKLGHGDDRPDFSTFSWISMIFCAGVGAGLIYWATIEWTHYIGNPPFDAAPFSAEARNWATSYGLFHWGPLAWTIYALPTVAISFQYYVRSAPSLRLSTAIFGLLPDGAVARGLDRALDALFMLCLMAGAGTSIGLAVPMISASFADATGFHRTLALDIGVVVCAVSMLTIATYAGLSRGMARLAEINIWLVFAFLMFVLAAGPTLFILRQGTESIGFMLQNVIRMTTYTDPVTRTGFVENWTIFYWAWWITYGPIVGIFVTRISRGRTLRELILSMAVFGSLGAWMFFVILGDYGLWLDLHDIVPVRQIVEQQGTGPAISAVIGSLPAGNAMRLIFAAIAVIFIAGTYNSKAYALAASSMRELDAGKDPPRWNRVFWALMLGLFPIALMSVPGGIKVAQSAVLIASLPLLVVALLMAINLHRSLKGGTC